MLSNLVFFTRIKKYSLCKNLCKNNFLSTVLNINIKYHINNKNSLHFLIS